MRPHAGRAPRARWPAGLVALVLACAPPLAGATGAPALRDIEVLVEVPPSNFVYRNGDQLVYGNAKPGLNSFVPPPSPQGVSAGALIGATVLVNLVVAALEANTLAELEQAAGPVGASLQSLDLQATTIEQLRQLLPAQGPRWHMSNAPLPQPVPPPAREPGDPMAGRFKRQMAPSPKQHLIDYARASAHEAVLFVRVLPLYRGLQGRMAVNVAALLIDRSGAERGEWVTQVMAPPAPRLEAAELARWWAEDRYRRFVVRGLRGALVPVVEELADPVLREQRRRQHAALAGVSFDEAGRPTDRLLGHAINTHKKASTACLLQAEPGELIYHFERTRLPDQIVAAAFCAGEKPGDWNSDEVPGMAWVHPVRAEPPVVLRRP